MNKHIALIAGALACSFLTSLAFAQNDDADEDRNAAPSKPMFAVLRAKPRNATKPPVASVPTWNGSYVYSGTTYNYTMVGTAPSTNTSTTVPVVIVPLKIVLTNRRGLIETYDPAHLLTNGNTVVQNTVLSPLFDSTTTYTQGGIDVGTTQYEDAYQRANFWGTVSTNTNYHILLGGPTVLPTQTLNVPSADGSRASEFGFTAGLVNINWFDPEIQSLITKLGIQPNTFPIFLTYDVYLTNGNPTSGNCCIGGYHSYTGTMAYAHATYVDVVGAFSQNVSALSHEIGEWIDDPLTNNTDVPSKCGQTGNLILEVGDPLEGETNYGGFPYSLHGFTYDLQDLVFLTYFGAPTSTSVNGWISFQDNTSLTVCSNGG